MRFFNQSFKMKLAIHNSQKGFHPRWVTYCEEQHIPFKRVNCYANDIVTQLADCDALMWHHSQGNPKDILIAKQILFALEHTGFSVFPDFRTAWHFDDKAGQKFLLESIGAPLVSTYVFFDQGTALKWASQTNYPKVWKLRGGAGSANVQLVRSKTAAIRKINKAFSTGFPSYDGWGSLQERWRKYRLGKAGAFEVMKGIARLAWAPSFAKTNGRERGYAYFQEFIPGNDSDTRIVAIGGKAFALKRFVRKKDFRASGSGHFAYGRELFDERCVAIALELNDKLKVQCLAYDFVFDKNSNPLLVEISYGFTPSGYDDCPGYWNRQLQWHDGKFDPYGWMVELLIENIAR